jgi:hypothetical protein
MASYEAAEKAECSAAAVMTCYTFEAAQASARRMEEESSEVQEQAVGTDRRADQLTVVRCMVDSRGKSFYQLLIYVDVCMNGTYRHTL